MSGPDRAVIEVTIPMDYFEVDDMEDSCPICMHGFCGEDCPHHICKVSCCRQHICASCLTRSARRCKCQKSCKQIIVTCPFCRDMCPVDSLAVFCSLSKVCKTCTEEESDEEVETAATAAPSSDTDR